MTPTDQQDFTTQALSEISAENMLLGMEAWAEQEGVCQHVLDTFHIDCDDLVVRQMVWVSRSRDGGFQYRATDGWGNYDASTREDVLKRLTTHKANLIERRS